MIFGFSFS